MKFTSLLIACGLALVSASAQAQILITEWMYDGSEFFELTNVGASSADLTGWSYADADAPTPGVSLLTSFGTIAPGESVIIAQSASASAFRTAWNLSPTVKVLTYSSGLFQRSDTINIYNSSNVLVDKLAFGDNTIGGIRTNNATGITTPSHWGEGLTNPTAVLNWQLSTLSDGFSWASTGGQVGNPGILAVPEPSTWALIGLASGVVLWRRFRRV